MKWIVGLLFCFSVHAATDFEDGSLLLTAEEVRDTRALLGEMRYKAQEQQYEIQELKKQVEFYRTSRCL